MVANYIQAIESIKGILSTHAFSLLKYKWHHYNRGVFLQFPDMLDTEDKPKISNFMSSYIFIIVLINFQINGIIYGVASGASGSLQKPRDGTSKALLNLLDKFWNAISPVNSTILSSSKKIFNRSTIWSVTC